MHLEKTKEKHWKKNHEEKKNLSYPNSILRQRSLCMLIFSSALHHLRCTFHLD